MQLTSTRPTTLGTLKYNANLTVQEWVQVGDGDTRDDIEVQDNHIFTKRGSMKLEADGPIGAAKGYATLKEALVDLSDKTNDLLGDNFTGEDALEFTAKSPELQSPHAAAVVEHDGRFFGVEIKRGGAFQGTEALGQDPDLEDSQTWNGYTYDVTGTVTGADASLRAIVDGPTLIAANGTKLPDLSA